MTKGKVITFMGVKGGVGQSLLLTNLGVTLAKKEKKRVILLDCFPNRKDLAIFLNLSSLRTMDKILDFLEKEERLFMVKGYFSLHTSGVQVLGGPREKSLTPKGIVNLINFLKDECDYLIIDCPKSFYPVTVKILENTNLIISLLTPDVTSLEQVEWFKDKFYSYSLSGRYLKFGLNFSGIKGGLSSNDIEKIIGEDLFFKIPYEERMQMFLNQKKIIVLEDLESPFSLSILELSDKLKNEEIYRKDIEKKEEKVDLTIYKSKIYSIFNEKMKEMKEEKKDEELREWVERTLLEVIDSQTDIILPQETRKKLLQELIDDILGLGCIEEFIRDTDVTEIMVNGHDKIYIEKRGKLHLTDKKFIDDEQLMTVIERIILPLGRRIDESSPMVDARLKDGSRVNAIIPPLAIDGPALTIRKFFEKKLTIDDLVNFGSITPEMGEFLKMCVKIRKNIVVSGGTGSGKTTFLNILSGFIPEDERIVTVEDSAELRLVQPHVVRLEARPPNIEGKGAVPIRQLVINCLRMRPDRIVVGECRGGEALDMLQAMNTGHDGSLTTVHANSPKDAISRLETLVMMAGMELPSRAIREQIAGAVDLIVQTNRFSDGTRKIEKISEVLDCDPVTGEIKVEDIFSFIQEGIDEKGKVIGKFTATGYIPTFINQIRAHGIEVNERIFEKNAEFSAVKN